MYQFRLARNERVKKSRNLEVKPRSGLEVWFAKRTSNKSPMGKKLDLWRFSVNLNSVQTRKRKDSRRGPPRFEPSAQLRYPGLYEPVKVRRVHTHRHSPDIREG